MTALTHETLLWTPVCRLTDLQPERGVAALVDGVQVAVFRMYDDVLYAIGNLDPYSGAYVLSRGIVGTSRDAPTVASPMLKHVFDLRTGRSLGDDTVTVPTYPVRLAGAYVEVAVT